ncbi:unnamed protein product [Orchesella dallaii]|uniref:Ubiquitin-like domain-containing protein n=1 Tax=Orchesella dallaii TaxID=48710 RepID=A0ABP1R9Z8_9HEXA
MTYNATIRSPNSKVLGKTFLEGLSDLPSNWQVKYRDRIIPRSTDLSRILCDEKVPLSIYTKPVEEDFFQITVQPTPGRQFEMYVCKKYTVLQLRQLLFEMEGIPIEAQWVLINSEYRFEAIFAGIFHMGTLHDEGTLEEYKFRPGSVLTIVILPIVSLGGSSTSGLTTVDLEVNQVKGNNGALSSYSWDTYYYGLNVYGPCQSGSYCVSKNIREGLTMYRAGYVNLRLEPSRRNNFMCGACRKKFLPTNFLVSAASSLFRYKEAGSSQIQTTVLEASGELTKYSVLDSKGDEVKYDVMEISCVKPEESFHICVCCDQRIKWKKEVVLYDCFQAHPVHRACQEPFGCGVCRAKLVKSDRVEAHVKKWESKSKRRARLD